MTTATRTRALLRAAYRRLPGKQRAFELLRRVWVPPESIYQHLHFQGVISVTGPEGLAVRMVHHGYQVENSLFWTGLTGGWERVSLGLWLKLCAEARTIVDVGANTGVYALVAKARAPGAKVIAIEPVHRVFEKLEANVRLNSFDVECVEVAASDRDGTATIFDPGTEHLYSVTVDRDRSPEGTKTTPTEIRTARLDSLAEARGWPSLDLLKIDVETHEVEVLRGMGALLARDRPAMLIEILDEEVGRGVEEAVEGLGYVYFNIDERAAPRRVPHIGRSDTYNYLLCSPEQARRLGLR